jgi:G3E family GTPase
MLGILPPHGAKETLLSLFAADTSEARVAVTVLTGFLGSGKTTVLNRALRSPQFADTAVIVNEFGAIGLDHLLIESVDGEMVLLQSGCICCSVRSDLETSLRELLARRDDGRIGFSRIVIETTGLADPAPIAQLALNNPLTAPFLAPARIVTTIDAPCGERHLREHWEARKQIVLADAVLLTQADVAPDSVAALGAAVAQLNPGAPQVVCTRGDVEPELLLAPGSALPSATAPAHEHHHGDIASLALEDEAPLDWLRLQSWLARLRSAHGAGLLRVKGIVELEGEAQPVVIQGIHHVFHPPVRLAAWPPGPRRSRLVLIVQGLDTAALRESFRSEVSAAASGATA